MKKNHTSRSSKLVALIAGAAIFGLISQSAMALTAAGTSLTNLATLQYAVGGVAQNSIGSSPTGNSVQNATPTTVSVSGTNGALNTAFIVDNKVNVTVAGGVITNVTPGQVGALTPFTVTNTGNATQGYNLVAADAVNGAYTVAATAVTDNFNPAAAYSIFANPSCDGVTIVGGAITSLLTVPAAPAVGSTVCLLVQNNIAVTQLNGDVAVVSLSAATTWPTPLIAAQAPTGAAAAGLVNPTTYPSAANTPTVDVVFADAAGVIAGDVVSNGAHSTYGAYKVASAALSVAKVATPICDPVDGATTPKNIPGAFVQYAITITNTGSGSATLTSVTDALAASLAFDPKLISGAGTPAATTCTSAGGTSLSATGFSAIRGAGATPYVAPGAAGQNVTAGADFGVTTPGTVTINFATLTGASYGAANAVLAAGSYVTVYFNAIVQ